MDQCLDKAFFGRERLGNQDVLYHSFFKQRFQETKDGFFCSPFLYLDRSLLCHTLCVSFPYSPNDVSVGLSVSGKRFDAMPYALCSIAIV
jgi:hypothetical protein